MTVRGTLIRSDLVSSDPSEVSITYKKRGNAINIQTVSSVTIAVRRGLDRETSSQPVPPFPVLFPSATIHPHTYKPCLTPGISHGPIVPLLHKSQNTPTLWRRPRLLEASSAQFSTVPPPIRSSIRAHFDSSVDSRFTHLVVFPMYSGARQPRPSQRGGHQVVARVLHHGHVLICDRVHRGEPPQSIHVLYR